VLTVRGEKSDLNGVKVLLAKGSFDAGPVSCTMAANGNMGDLVPTYHSFSPHAPPATVGVVVVRSLLVKKYESHDAGTHCTASTVSYPVLHSPTIPM
jgi:hypothetical protein